MPDYQTPFHPDHYYHLFNHAVGSENLFRNADNYSFFLKKVKQYLVPVFDIFSYNLLLNHYHFFLKVKTESELKSAYQSVYPFKKKELTNKEIPEFVLQQISNFQNSYAKSYNKVFGRRGRLFLESVKRSEVITEDYFSKIIHYVHANAVHHGICKRIEDWPHSSYHALISTAPTLLKRDELLDWFGGVQAFIQFHQQAVELKLKEED